MFGIWMRPSMRSSPPDGGLKLDRTVSIRAEVHWPEPLRIGVITRLPLPSWRRFEVLFVYVWISPVPQLAGPPGYCVPVSMIQFAEEGRELAPPVKSSLQTRLQPDGVGGSAARALTVTASMAATTA